jgi:hypothetical protein
MKAGSSTHIHSRRCQQTPLRPPLPQHTLYCTPPCRSAPAFACTLLLLLLLLVVVVVVAIVFLLQGLLVLLLLLLLLLVLLFSLLLLFLPHL